MSQALRVIDGGRGDDGESLPPHDLRLEDSVVGNAIFQPELWADLAAVVKATTFFSERCRQTWLAIERMVEAGTPVDLLTVRVELSRAGRLAQVGEVWLIELCSPGVTPTLVRRHVLEHARTLRELWVRREAMKVGRLLSSQAHAGVGATAELLTSAASWVGMLQSEMLSGDVTGVAEVATRTAARMQAAIDSPGTAVVPTGLAELDRVVGGLPIDLAVLAALPGEGKTALATAIAVNVARAGGGVLIASLETPNEELLTRMVAAEMGLPVKRSLMGKLTAPERALFTEGLARLSALPLFFEHGKPSVREMFAKARAAQMQLSAQGKRLALVVVDYLQLVPPPARRDKRHEEVADITRALKGLTGELHCPVLALSQLNASKIEERSGKGRKGRPKIGDLAESGELRKCGRLILGLHRPEGKDTPEGEAEIAVWKDNNGASGGVVRLHFDGPSTRFSAQTQAPHLFNCRCGNCPDVPSPRDAAPVNAPQPEDPAFWDGHGGAG